MPFWVAAGVFVIIVGALAFGFVRMGSAVIRDAARRRTRGVPVWEHFRDCFSQSGLSEPSLRVVYDFLRSCMNVEFAIYPDDDLKETYGIGRHGGVPLSDALDEIRVALSLPQPVEPPKGETIRSPIELVEFFAREMTSPRS